MAVPMHTTGWKIAALPAVCVAILGALETGICARAAEFQGQVSDYQTAQIYHSPETPGYTAWTGLWKLPDGTIQANFVQATGPQNNPVITYPVLESRDSGQTWTRVAGDIPTGYSRGMAVLPDGTMVRPEMTLVFGPSGILQRADSFTGVERSTDGGATWSQPIDLASDDDYQCCYPMLIRPLSDGSLVAVAGLVADDVAPEDVSENITKTMFVSSDQGQSWGEPIVLMSPEDGFCEESDFVELPGGGLLFIHRAHHISEGGSVYQDRRQSTVTRVGDTFIPNPPNPTVPFAGSGLPCELMTKEGVILDMDIGGSHWSDDQGQTWNNLMAGGQPLRTNYYPRAVQADDGTIVVVSHIGKDNVYGTADQAIMVQTFRLEPIDIHNGIPNAIPNGGFDSDLSGWTGGGPGSMSWDPSTSPDGGSLLLLGPYEGYPEQRETLTFNADETLYVSYTAYSPDTTGNLIVRVYDFDTDGWMSGSSIPKTTLHQGWDTYSFELTIPADLDGHHFTVTFDSYQYGGANEHVYIDNVRVINSSIMSMPGDANQDGKVDAIDAGILAANWLKTGNVTWAEGDFNEDGIVDDVDATIMAANYGASSSAVPEPVVMALLLAAIPALCLLRRR